MTGKATTVKLSGGGRKMPYVGLGTYEVKGEEVGVALRAALECGYRHVDTAASYQNEEAIGDVLQEWLTSGKVTREELFITTKLPFIGTRAGDVAKFLQKSLQKLRVSYVDLYLIHSPVGFMGQHDEDHKPVDSEGNRVVDPNTDLESTWRAMEDQVECGRAHTIGISNFNSVQINRIMKGCRIPPANLQVEAQIYHQQKDLKAFCHKLGISFCAYSPLGAPYLTNGTGDRPPPLKHPRVTSIATRLKRTPAQVLLRFLIQLDMIVIPKSSNPDRIRENFQVFDFELSQEDMSSLEALDCGKEGRIVKLEESRRHHEYPFDIPF
ncbi:aldo-keto reductase family 1 member B1-like [Panulirus ornatus]|uniref:aldo-keto reductase family 1 member B1-like n=1 Tax=Panulirus ornatus TaxID=150431 RepID=UPI003A89E4B8